MTPRDTRRLIRMEHRQRKIELMEAVTCLALAAGLILCFCINAKVEALQEEETPPQVSVDTPTEEKPVKTAENAQKEQVLPDGVVEISEPKLKSEPLPELETVTAPTPRYDATEAELAIVARVVHSEAVGEGFDGMALVAQCVLNTCEATGKRPDEVVLEPKQYADPAKTASEEVIAAVEAVFVDGYQVTEEPIRFFYAPARCTSSWHENNLDYVGTWGGHRFFKVIGT